MKTNRRVLVAVPAALAGALILAAAAPAVVAAQDGTDARWLPWLGCWESEGAPGGSLLCIVPMAGDPGVEMVSVEGTEVVSREWVRADGEMNESSREGCRGWERADFSEDQARIYLDADHVCEGDVRQETTGMLALLSPSEWIDVRSVNVSGQAMTGVNRYRLAPSDVAEAAGFGAIAADRAMAVRAARVNASARPGIEDVVDASGRVADDVVRAWVAARQESFRVDGDDLVRMADAGVSADVIDVMVAASYPQHFTLGEGQDGAERRPRDAAAASTYYRGPRRFWDPFYGYGYYGYDPFYSRSRYDYGYGGRYGYDGYGYGFGFRPTVIVVAPRDPEPEGRVVNGRGYTRNRPPSGSSSPAPARSSGDSGGSSAGSGSSSSGGSTPRKAMPRPTSGGGGG